MNFSVNLRDEDGEPSVWKWGVLIFGGLVGLILLLGSFGTVEAGERGVRTRFSNVVGGVTEPGLYFKIPFIEGMKKMNVRTQTVTYEREEPLFSASKDLQDVQIATVLNYHLDPAKVVEIYQQYGTTDSYEERIIRPAVRDTVKAVASQYTAEELVTKRPEFTDNVTKVLNERLQDKWVTIERVNITNFQFSPAFTQAIEAKVTAVQNAEAAKNSLERVKFEAEQRIAQAKGEAEAIRIQAQAITQQGGDDYVKLKWVEKWNGVLPQTSLGESTALVNIR